MLNGHVSDLIGNHYLTLNKYTDITYKIKKDSIIFLGYKQIDNEYNHFPLPSYLRPPDMLSKSIIGIYKVPSYYKYIPKKIFSTNGPNNVNNHVREAYFTFLLTDGNKLSIYSRDFNKFKKDISVILGRSKKMLSLITSLKKKNKNIPTDVLKHIYSFMSDI